MEAPQPAVSHSEPDSSTLFSFYHNSAPPDQFAAIFQAAVANQQFLMQTPSLVPPSSSASVDSLALWQCLGADKGVPGVDWQQSSLAFTPSSSFLSGSSSSSSALTNSSTEAASALLNSTPITSRPRKRQHGEDDLKEDNENEGAAEHQMKLLEESMQMLDPSMLMSSENRAIFRVPGRLCVVGTNRFYEVSLEEVKRRLSMPEAMNKSSLGPLLRRGKTKGCGGNLQEHLRRFGLSLTSGKKKGAAVCTLTALTEDEALTLAEDHRRMIEQHFAFEAFARVLVERTPPVELRNRITKMNATIEMMDELLAVHAFFCSSPNWRETTAVEGCILRDFSLVTHGFGIEEFKTAVQLVKRHAEESRHWSEQEIHRLSAGGAREGELVVASRYNQQYMEVFPFYTGDNSQGVANVSDALNVVFGHAFGMDNNNTNSSCLNEQVAHHTFTEVPGRLSITNRKYSVSMPEIQRRLAPPESLNGSILGAVLRKAKTKDNGSHLREELQLRGVELPAGRRKCSPVSTFTSLVEEESLMVARDMRALINRYFPLQDIATHFNRSTSLTSMVAIQMRMRKLCMMKDVLVELVELLREIELPCSDRSPSTRSPLSHLLAPYSLITHGFGPDETLSWLQLLDKLAETAFKSLPLVDSALHNGSL